MAFVEADIPLMSDGVRQEVLRRLAARFGTRYTEQNVMLTASHTHSGPGGYLHYLLYNITTLGFRPGTFDAIASGITEAIVKADQDLAPGNILLGRGSLTTASRNRSKVAFDRNPVADKAFFPDAVDPLTTVLRFERGGRPIGMINWFATHNTSMTTKNTLTSADNKGYAGYHWEREVSGQDYLAPSSDDFVAAFAQSNSGDMTPNLNLRPGSGPTEDEFANTRIIGTRQYDAARTAFNSASRVQGGVDTRFSYVDLSTEDGGGGLPIFNEGTGENPIFGLVSSLLYTASPSLKQCQAPKEVLLPSGTAGITPEVLPLQLMRIGPLYLIGVPQEFTIVSGLRIRRTVASITGAPLENVIVAGYANSYAGYVTTPEEYEQGEYEAGHTLFGKWELPAYQQEFARLATDMKTGQQSVRGTPSPDLSGQQLVLHPGVVLDTPQPFHSFGDVLVQPFASYAAGQQVSVVFTGAHPTNDRHRRSTYSEVQRLVSGQWKRVQDDGDWATKFRWARDGIAASKVTISWDVPAGTAPGSYRIVYHGDAKGLLGNITAFTGVSRSFTVQ